MPTPHDSIVYVVSGKLKGTMDGKEFIMGPGDVCRHPKGVLHGVEALEDSVIMECKSPAPDISAFMASSSVAGRANPRAAAVD